MPFAGILNEKEMDPKKSEWLDVNKDPTRGGPELGGE